MTRKKLPIGIQTFREIREEDHYYVDKTPFAIKLATKGKYYFLSRPRRFGKSLFLDTLAELFAGNEPLFRGLYAHDQWDWAVKYPVIRISFAEGRLESRQQLDERIRWLLDQNQQRLGVACKSDSDIPGCFSELLQHAAEKYGRRVVVLVDEYDKPILDNLTTPEVASAMREGLRNLYSVIKGQDAHIKFAFLTGVSKFSKVSLFSGLNNLSDITVDTRYSSLCGYTDAEVDTVFAAELAPFDRDEIRRWYNGYNWTGTAVYNPFDLLLLFDRQQFSAYWFETGTPTFLINLLIERQIFLPDLEQLIANEALLSTFDIGDMSTEALLFQTGYLTIARIQHLGRQRHFYLGYPNLEVRSSLTDALLRHYQPDQGNALKHSARLYELLAANDFDGLRTLFTAFFASIPHHWYSNNPIAQYEGYYASVFYAYFASLGLDIVLEDVTNHGRIDMTLRFNQQVYLFEFKVVEMVPAGNALAQIKHKNYADKYRARGEPIHLIGVEFSKESRSVVGYGVETLRLD